MRCLCICVYYTSTLTHLKNSKTLCGCLSPLSCNCQDEIKYAGVFIRGKTWGKEIGRGWEAWGAVTWNASLTRSEGEKERRVGGSLKRSVVWRGPWTEVGPPRRLCLPGMALPWYPYHPQPGGGARVRLSLNPSSPMHRWISKGVVDLLYFLEEEGCEGILMAARYLICTFYLFKLQMGPEDLGEWRISAVTLGLLIAVTQRLRKILKQSKYISL